jgi:hypothetical protein
MPRLFFLLALVAACSVGMHLPGTGTDLIDDNGTHAVLLERILWQLGLYPVTGIWSEGHYVDWTDAAWRSLWYIPAFLLPDGKLSLFGERLDGRNIAVTTEPRPDLSVLDVTPTACSALGLHASFDGIDVCRVNASQVVVIYIDALGWYRYILAKPTMGNLSSLGPVPACCVYPSVSNVNGAAMLTGACPERSGIDRWENRTMLTDDAISLALRNGVSAAWIDGPRPPVSLRQGIIRTGDTDGYGSFDDEIAARAVAEYANGTRLLYVHLSDTDRTLHAYGPYSEQSFESAARADALIGHISNHLKHGTLLIVVSDHGGHEIEGGRGDHGSLLPQDMIIPFAVRWC